MTTHLSRFDRELTVCEVDAIGELARVPRELDALNDLLATMRAATTLLEGARDAMQLHHDSELPISKRQKDAADLACIPIVDALRRCVPLFRAPRYTVQPEVHYSLREGPTWTHLVVDGSEVVREFRSEEEADDYARRLNAELPL